MTEPEIIYEDENFMAVSKPAGLLVHGARDVKYKTRKKRDKKDVSGFMLSAAGKEPTLTDWLLKNYPEIKSVGDDPMRPGIVHRLDKETSGVMVVAKNQKYFEYLKSLFKKREIRKTYVAIVSGALKPPIGVIDKPIGIKNGTIKRSVRSAKMSKEAITEYKVIGYLSYPRSPVPVLFDAKSSYGANPRESVFSVVEVYPKTGRTHQIRVHFASIGYPIVGDKLYGGKTINGISASFNAGKLQMTGGEARAAGDKSGIRLMLHAKSIDFISDDGKRIRLDAELPEEFAAFARDVSR